MRTGLLIVFVPIPKKNEVPACHRMEGIRNREDTNRRIQPKAKDIFCKKGAQELLPYPAPSKIQREVGDHGQRKRVYM